MTDLFLLSEAQMRHAEINYAISRFYRLSRGTPGRKKTVSISPGKIFEKSRLRTH